MGGITPESLSAGISNHFEISKRLMRITIIDILGINFLIKTAPLERGVDNRYSKAFSLCSEENILNPRKFVIHNMGTQITEVIIAG